jgi:hypothetical protein
VNDAANTGGTALGVPAPTLAVAATAWADAGPDAGVAPARPAAIAATATARAAVVPRTAFGKNLMCL